MPVIGTARGRSGVATTLLRRISVLALIGAFGGGQTLAQGQPAALPNRPEALVASVYEQVVARHPLGVPHGADADVLAPYLSKALLHRFDLNTACDADWLRQNPGPNLKPPGVFEDGLFSGGSEQAEPTAFHIENAETGKDGSSRVYVKLSWGSPANMAMVWYVAAVVVPEDGRLVVDDVFYLRSKSGDPEGRLSEALSSGCDGGRWVGRPG